MGTETKKFKIKTKKRLLVCLIETSVKAGYDITDFLCKPLSYFDFEKVIELIKKIENELSEEGYPVMGSFDENGDLI